MDILPVEDASELADWRLPLSFMKSRHMEEIVGLEPMEDAWRVKEKLKTWSVALALCLNIGVDPPDTVKTNPCARTECWIDPLSMSPNKAMEQIGNNLQKQYERWQPRARYKQLLDPTTEEVRKLCIALRKNAKNERVLFHYNGHGVPRPTTNGEIWVFNKSYTQYIPLSIYDLQQWMSCPSVYVLDCSHAGQIVDSFEMFARERDSEFFIESTNGSSNQQFGCLGLLEHSILLASCGAKELLPMNPKLPADLFTCCLTTPIKTALHWFCLQKVSRLITGVSVDMIDKIPGKLNDRKTPLGELNWIFTAITDTIAWNVLPHDLFQKLFRQDLLVASLFRNFLLAERIMRSYNCSPISHPVITPSYQHSLWQAWDLVVDHIMSQLPYIIDGSREYVPSNFFQEQLNAFQVWLMSSPNILVPPMQLPIILQFLLSQAHRLQALELLGRYLDMGPQAVHAALSVGIYPYVLKLLASKLKELQPILVFIWAKILAVDQGCQSDLVKDGGYKYFISVLGDHTMQYEYRTMAAFILSAIVHNYPRGKEVCLQNNVISICLSQLDEPNAVLKQWLATCLGKLWQKYDAARWCGVRDSAHEKLKPFLWNDVPEVRAAAVYALGTYILNNSDDGRHSNHAINIEHTVVAMLLPVATDGSPLVRQELVHSIHGMVQQYEREFQIAALKSSENDRMVSSNLSTSMTPGGWINVVIDPEGSTDKTGYNSNGSGQYNGGGGNPHSLNSYDSNSDSSETDDKVFESPKKGSGAQPIAHYHDTLSNKNVYSQTWRGLQLLATDPDPFIAAKADAIINSVHDKIRQSSKARNISASNLTTSLSTNTVTSLIQPTKSHTLGRRPLNGSPNIRAPDIVPQASLPTRSAFSKINSTVIKKSAEAEAIVDKVTQEEPPATVCMFTETQFCNWSCKYFANSLMKPHEDCDKYSERYLKREYRFLRNNTIRQEAEALREHFDKAKFTDQIFFHNKDSRQPQDLLFHPYLPQLAVLYKTSWSIWDIDQGTRLASTNISTHSKISSAKFINPHDISFLLTGTDDGCVRVWKEYANEKDVALVTSWRALTDIQHNQRSVGMVLEWEQQSGILYTAGDVRYIRVWDTHKELRIQDIPTETDSYTTTIALDVHNRSLLAAGCGDGSIRLYDKRNPTMSSMVQLFKEHSSPVLSVCIQHVEQPLNNIVSISSNGDIRLWDPRFSKSTRKIATTPGITVAAIHTSLPALTCATSQAIKIYNIDNGDSIASIKYHDGFMGQKIGPTKSLAFHPYKLWMATGGTDGFISIYSSERKK